MSVEILTDRAKRISFARSKSFDLIVVGGGIHGVCVAALAARMGLSTVLLEGKDYAHATSSRSSKMAHGGLRYLEMLDFQQVFEGIKAREELFDKCPNLVWPESFLIPVHRGNYWLQLKLKLGLMLYDLMVRKSERRHKWIPRAKLSYESFHSDRGDLAGCYRYTDGLMSDARLVFDIVSAGQNCGLCALNYVRVDSVVQQSDSSLSVACMDTLNGSEWNLKGSLVVNCAGPWALDVCEKNTPRDGDLVRYSRGSHLVFSVPWRDPSLFLPLAERGRYYFVWPHPAGTLVGTTEREVSEIPPDPLPSPDEIEEILGRLKRDLPSSGLTRDTICYAFAGIRTLPVRRSKKGVSRLSRKHIWSLSRGVLTLFGGKYTTFAWTASEGLKKALQILGRASGDVPSILDQLPSAINKKEHDQVLVLLKDRYGRTGLGVERAVKRLGRQVLRYVDRPELWNELLPGVLILEVAHSIEVEHAETVEDVIRRRLELEATPSHGVDALEVVEGYLEKFHDREFVKAHEERWMVHLKQVTDLLGQGS
jgi:glycerol-3-phosphate dehydrogenase